MPPVEASPVTHQIPQRDLVGDFFTADPGLKPRGPGAPQKPLAGESALGDALLAHCAYLQPFLCLTAEKEGRRKEEAGFALRTLTSLGR